MTERQRIAAVALDAAELSDIRLLAAAGMVPNLEKLLDDAALVDITGDPVWGATASWPELLGGRTPDELGYWSPLEFDPATYHVWDTGAFRGTPFYARPDLVPIVFDLPYSAVSPDALGIQVTAWGAHGSQFPTASRPNHVISEIDARFPVNRALVSGGRAGWHNDVYARNLVDALVEGVATKVDIAKWLQDREPRWDLFLMAFTETHTAGHQFLHGVRAAHPLRALSDAVAAQERFETVYSAVDAAVGRLLASFAPETTIVVFSVRGMRESTAVPGSVLVAELFHRSLFRRPFIDFPPHGADRGPVVPGIWTTAEEHLLRLLSEPKTAFGSGTTASIKHRLAWMGRRHLPSNALELSQRLVRRATGRYGWHTWWEMKVRPPWPPGKDVTRQLGARLADAFVTAWYARYWAAMPYFVLPSLSDCHIRVNVRGRERDGVVDGGEYVDALDGVERLLRQLTDARTGRPVVDAVVRTRPHGPLATGGPPADLVVTFAQPTDVVHHPDAGTIGPAPMFLPGDHSPAGWMAIRAPSGVAISRESVRPRDVAPTLLRLAGLDASPLLTGAPFASSLPTA